MHIGDPVAQRLVHRILERARTGRHAAHLRAHELHAEDIGLLPLDIDFAHIDDARIAETRGDSRGGDAVLAGASLGDDAGLAHAFGQQNLAEAIVDLVRAGVIEVFALQVDLRAAKVLGQAFGEVERIGPADIILEQAVQLGVKSGIGLRLFIGAFKIKHERHQRLGDEAAAIGTEVAGHVRAFAVGVWRYRAHADFSVV